MQRLRAASRRWPWLTEQRPSDVVFISLWLAGAGVVSYQLFDDVQHHRPTHYLDAFVRVALILLLAGHLTYRYVRDSGQLRRARMAATHLLHSLSRVTELDMGQLELDELLPDLIRRVRLELNADAAALLLLSEDRSTLQAAAADGYPAHQDLRETLPAAEGVAWRAVLTGGLEVQDRDGEDALTVPPTPARGIAAAALHGRERLIGVLQVTRTTRPQWNSTELELLGGVANRAAGMIERAALRERERKAMLSAQHARRHLSLLVEASKLFAGSLDDYIPALRGVVDIAVGEFADYGAVYLAADGELLSPLVAAHTDSELQPTVEQLSILTPPQQHPLTTVMASGNGLLIKTLQSRRTEDELDLPFLQIAQRLKLDSAVLAPIRTHGLSFGVFVFGTVRPRRGYRPSDLAAAEELATRAAATVERTLLFREVQAAADTAQRGVVQLRMISEAAVTINAPLALGRALEVAVGEARRVAGTERAHVRVTSATRAYEAHSGAVRRTVSTETWRYLEGLRQPLAASDTRTSIPAEIRSELPRVWMATPFASTTGDSQGILIVGDDGGDRAEFSPDDQAVLTLLAQVVKVAVDNALLYASVEANEARLAAVFDASPMAILELDAAGEVARSNRAARTLFDFGETEPVRFDTDVQGRLQEIVSAARASNAPVYDELPLRRSDGELRLLAATGVLLGHTAPAGALVLVSDITEQRRLEEHVSQVQRLDTAGRLAGGIAHDFNNLLTVILGHTETLLHKIPDEDPLHRHVAAINRSGTRAAALTNQLLTISRRQVFRPVAMVPDDSIRAFDDTLRRVVGESVQLDLDLGAAGAMVHLDPEQFEQILLNLVVNSKDAMPDGGRVVIRTVLPDPAHVDLSVADTGTGMDAETLAHCLEPFFTTKDRHKGTGLGLAAVYGMVRQNGGEVLLDSAPGRGTTVTLRLPVDSDGAREETAAPDVSGPGIAERADESEVILLVEDEEEVRWLARSVLEGAGYLVMEAENGLQALDRMTRYEGRLDLLVTDVVMPAMSGVELARRLCALRPELPVLFVSGYSENMPDLGDNTHAVSRFLAKPFTAAALAHAVRETCDLAAQGSKR